MFEKSTYIERRKKLKSMFKSGLLFFPGNTESPMNYPDNTYRYRQDSTFSYFFGLNRPDIFGLLDIDKDEDSVFGDDAGIDSIIWTGNQPTIRDLASNYGIETSAKVSILADILKQAQNKGIEIHFLPPYRAETKIQILNLLGIHPDDQKNKVSVQLIKAVAALRNVKSQEELIEIEKSVNISVDMHVAAMHMIKPGLTEAKIAGKVHEVALAAGGDIAFPIIATINGQTLHNHYHGNALSKGQMFLLDAGAEIESMYCGDLSSTIPVDLIFSNRQKEIYQISLKAHEIAVAALKPGVRFMDIHLLAAREIANGLKEIGLMKGDVDEAVAKGAHALFFPCGLGHLMGLDVHDMENLGEEYVGYSNEAKSTLFGLKSLRLGRELKPGFVLTIEPGIYFIPELIDYWKSENRHLDFLNYDKIESYKNFGGIRNEENFVITETGHKLLGKPKPMTIEEVEAERARPRT